MTWADRWGPVRAVAESMGATGGGLDMMRRRIGCVLAASGMWLLTGCFDSDGNGQAHNTPSSPLTPQSPPSTSASAAPSSQPPVVACKLLTTKQVQDVLGAAAITTRAEEGDRACVFIGPTGETVLTVRVGDVPRALIGGPEQVARLTASPTARTEQVPGIADAAVFYSDPDKGNGIAFARGRGERVTSVNLMAAGPNAQTGRYALVTLATSANEALP